MLRNTMITLLMTSVLAMSGCGSGSSAKPTPSPSSATGLSISSVSPGSAVAGSPDLALTVIGANFDGAGVIRTQAVWSASGSNTLLATTVVSSTQLTVMIPASLLAKPVTAHVLAENLDTLEGVVSATSNSFSFSVTTPTLGTPFISSISPTSAVAGSPDLTLTITGTSFAGTAHNIRRAVWSANGSNTTLATTPVNNMQLTTVVPAAMISRTITAQVFIEYGDPMGDVPLSHSNAVGFTVIAANLASVSPAMATLGPRSAQQFLATLNGKAAEATWSVAEGTAGGSITSAGVYTAPPVSGIFHVIASSTKQPANSATATVTVVNSGFTPTASMHASRSGHRATLLTDGKVLVVSGDDGSAELFDPETGTFALTGSMTTPRFGATFTLLANGKVLVAGGYGPGSTGPLPRLLAAELYDPQSGSFILTGNMGVGRVLHTATLLTDGRVLIAGGTDKSGGGGAATASAELYDPSTGTFTPAGGMLSDRAQHTATGLKSGNVLIAGGWNGHAADASDDPPWDPLFTELFDPTSGTFKYAGTMSTTRNGHTATLLTGGEVLLLGGVPSVQNIHNQPTAPRYAEIYDPSTENFSALNDLAMSRQGYTVTLLRSGEVLLAGGKILDLVVTTTELLDPTTGALSATGELGTERVGHTATLLKDGRVLITGGTDAKGNALASAELYK